MKQSEWLTKVVACSNCKHTYDLMALYLCEEHAKMLIHDVDSEEKRNIDMILTSKEPEPR
jgi:hypothetical protein